MRYSLSNLLEDLAVNLHPSQHEALKDALAEKAEVRLSAEARSQGITWVSTQTGDFTIPDPEFDPDWMHITEVKVQVMYYNSYWECNLGYAYGKHVLLGNLSDSALAAVLVFGKPEKEGINVKAE